MVFPPYNYTPFSRTNKQFILNKNNTDLNCKLSKENVGLF